ncbi:ATP-binding protein [Salinisphaera sp. P385]|uniref:ATP-binding protein n=1 Tax=Spectribacter acetivorans TaxID=3075603 RepID=A0ABU3BBS2_9GAMM|nr:ATP-binding protein [Salinisphaera sp. P385]MDT0619917.1 ATP-binding protein [Salinisphaera sp. P385]
MESQPLDFAGSEQRAGFRLHVAEVYNWGTFHDRVWRIAPGGDNALLTGDIGSGKSTLVDAITTLLVPAQRITYNKAAGAEARERSLRSYVQGYYKSERDASGVSVRPVALRDHNSYSVILGQFRNEGFDHSVTLAQVFWIKDQGQPERFYVVADAALTIKDHFADFGSDLNALKKRLRATEGVEVHDTFPPYGAAFRRRFGIGGEQALELFSQTVSMKSVGNLTEFVRGHMLEAAPVDDKIEALIAHFDDLNRAHDAVVSARRQIEMLEPLVADSECHAELSAQVEEWRECRDSLEPWFAGLKAARLERRIDKLDGDLARAGSRIDALEERRREQDGRRDELKQAISAHGGDRLEHLAREIEARRQEERARRERADRYNALARQLDFPEAVDANTFIDNRRCLDAERDAADANAVQAQNEHTETVVEFRELKARHDEIEAELASLRQRRSNLPAAMLDLRQRLCDDLGLDAETLPFAGELIQVRDDERDWEGAAERLLRNFGLSLLVPDERYRAVAEWVDRTHLRGRLVYYRVRERRERGPADLHPDSLVRKLAVRPDSAFYAWLETELARRFDYACCADLDRFRREPRAITRAGQTKAGGERHEKDDRHRIDDRSRYILGWSNEAKIEALEKRASDLQARMQETGGRITALEGRIDQFRKRAEAVGNLGMFADFRELDWQGIAAEIARLEDEKTRLERTSDRLRELREQLEELEAEQQRTGTELEQARDERSRLTERHERAEETLSEARQLFGTASERQRTQLFPRLDELRPEALGERQITVESCDNCQSEMRRWLQSQIDREGKQLDRLSERVVRAMSDFRSRWPLQAQEMDADLAAAGEYAALLRALKGDDLPRFEQRFKELLNENTIREVANFQAHLNRQRQGIRERIDTINKSLHAIDFNQGRYIELLAEPAPDVDIRDFQRDLRACTEGTLAGDEDDAYSESKFLQVREIIQRLRGREGTAEADRRWRRKVTDVRNWFTFSAEEKWREDDTAHEHYTDSGGKSGGQKEKLAYTVLAASLAYQFGLEWGVRRSRTFRFVVIDEAFGRGSDESARFGLELFQRLNLQLLIVTPLQKIHIIEPFVASVGFVHSPDGRRAMVRNLTIEEYHAEKAARVAGAPPRAIEVP